MLGSKTMMGIMFIFFLLTGLGLIMEGTWLGSREETMLKELTGYTTFNLSWYSFPLVLPGFIANGLPKLLSWDYAFLSGTSWGMWVRLLLSCTITIGIVWTFLQITLPIIGNLVSRVAGGLVGAIRGLF